MLDAAAELFSEKGYEATTLSEIVARSGGSLTTLYELFGSKAGLLVAMVGERCGHIAAVIDGVALGGRAPEEALSEIARYLLKLTNSDAIGLLRIVIAVSPRQPELGRLFYEAGPLAGRRIMGRYLAAEARRGALCIDDPEAAAVDFFQMLLGDLQMRALCALPVAADGAEAEAHIERTVAAFMRLYSSAGTSQR